MWKKLWRRFVPQPPAPVVLNCAGDLKRASDVLDAQVRAVNASAKELSGLIGELRSVQWLGSGQRLAQMEQRIEAMSTQVGRLSVEVFAPKRKRARKNQLHSAENLA